MPRNSRRESASVVHGEMVTSFQRLAPHLQAWLDSYDDFSELRIKARDDGTVLGIAKGYDSNGGPVVCFGVGYDGVAALLALDRAINGGNWRVDKPWSPKGK